MNNEQHPLDDLFKQRLEDAAAPVPDDMWARIERVRQQRRRKYVILWSLTGVAAAFLVGGLFAYWHFSNTGTSSPTSHTITEVATAQSTIRPEKSTAQVAVPTAPPAAVAAEPVAVPAPIVIRTSPGHTEAHIPASRPATKVTHTEETNDVPPSANDETALPAPAEMPVPTLEFESLPVEAPVKTEDAMQDENEEETFKPSGPHQRERFSAVAQLPVKNFFESAPVDIKLFANNTIRCARFDNPPFHWDLEWLAGPAYAPSLLAAKTPESTAHLTKRLETETPGVSYNAGVRLGITSNAGLGLKTGLQYSQINDRFTYYVGRRMDVSVIWGPNGEIVGRDTVYTEGRSETRTNRLQFVEVPLLLGYERRVGKFRIGINAGAFLNLHFNANGAIYSPVADEPIDFGQEGDRNVLPIFRQDASASWYAGLSVAYNLRSRYSLIAEPYFKTFPNALSSSDYDLQQRYWMTGLQLGMRMRL